MNLHERERFSQYNGENVDSICVKKLLVYLSISNCTAHLILSNYVKH